MTSTELFTNFHLSYWVLQTVAMLLTALLLPGLRVSGPIPAFFTVLVLALINAKVWDAALFFSIPDSLSSQTLVLLAANALIFWVVVKLLPGIEIEGVVSAILAPILFTISSLFLSHYEKEIDWQQVWDRTKETANDVKDYVDTNAPNVTQELGR